MQDTHLRDLEYINPIIAVFHREQEHSLDTLEIKQGQFVETLISIFRALTQQLYR